MFPWMCYLCGRMKETEPKARSRAGRSQASVRQPSRRLYDAALARLKGRLLRRMLAETDNPGLHAALRRAATESESLAWLTPFPLLVLPTLMEERAREARFYAARQAELREMSRDWLSLAE